MRFHSGLQMTAIGASLSFERVQARDGCPFRATWRAKLNARFKRYYGATATAPNLPQGCKDIT